MFWQVQNFTQNPPGGSPRNSFRHSHRNLTGGGRTEIHLEIHMKNQIKNMNFHVNLSCRHGNSDGGSHVTQHGSSDVTYMWPMHVKSTFSFRNSPTKIHSVFVLAPVA